MTKDEIIASLLDQLKDSNKQVTALTGRVNELLAKVAELTAIIKALQEEKGAKEKTLRKANNTIKGLGKLLEKENEQQVEKPQLTDEEKKVLDEARSIRRKARGNNGAKRDVHEECEVEYKDVYPDDPSFDKLKAHPLEKMKGDGTPDYQTCTRYVYVPGHFKKVIYRLHRFTQDGKVFEPKTPPAVFMNSNYTSSFVAGLLQLRYMYAMPVERIIHYFEDQGFNLKKPTAGFLLGRAAETLENFYKAIRKAVLSDDYIASDETYFKILVPEKNSKGKGVKKGYFWVIVGQKSGLLYVVYRDGSRAGDVIYDELHEYHGTMHSDAASFYRKIQGDDFPNITRIACLQHIKRKFIDCMDAEPEAREMVKLINKLYHEEHKHKIGEKGWTVKDNFKWRRQYAPAILAEIKAKLGEILNRPDLLPDSELSEAASYFNNEWEAVVDIFKRGDTELDNNLVERMNRYFSMSRRSSLFFGSHKGAERAAVLYTLALSAKMNHLNLFGYLADILDRTATWQPNTPLEKYRNLLPDRWQPSTED